MKKNLLLFCVLLLAGQSAYPDETGRPFMTMYTSKEIEGHTQFWAMAQDDRGIMYIGDGYGVQEFDGSTWRLILPPNHSFGRSLAKDVNGRIYVGSSGMLGYLEADDRGIMQYRSLLEFIKPEDRLFNYVWSVQTTPVGIYFQTNERLFRFCPNPPADSAQNWEVQVWHPEGRFGYTFWIDQTLYVQQLGSGMMKMVDDSLVLMPGGEQFANDRIHVMLPFPGQAGSYVIGTFTRGLFLWDGNAFRPFPTDSDALLRDGTLYTGTITPDSCFALGTMANGLLVIDTHGMIKQHIAQAAGFMSNTMSCLFVDRQNNLWVGMDGGVAVLEYDSPLSEFDVPGGTGPSDFRRYKGVLYISTNDGVYYLDGADGHFKRVAGIAGSAQSFFFYEINGELFATTNIGIYGIEGKTAFLSLPNEALNIPVLYLCSLSLEENILVAGTVDGIDLLRYDARDPHRLSRIGHMAETHEYVRYAVESEPGIVWVGTMDTGVMRLTFNAGHLMNPVIEKFGTESGLPIGGVTPFQVNKRLVFCTKQGICQFDPAQKRFAPDPFFNGMQLGRNPDESVIVTDKDGNIWVNLGKESAVYKKLPNGDYQLEKDLLARFADEVTNIIYPDNDGVVWFGTANSVKRFAPGRRQTEQTDFPALIRRVTLASDSVIYHGGAKAGSRLDDPAGRRFPFRQNALRFDFSASSYLNPSANEFRSQLEGFDANGAPWSSDTRRYYTNLPTGTYRFRVQARNIFGHESSEDVYAFTINPPLYGTWWAWCLYVLGAGGLIFGLVRARTRQLQERSKTLERIVEERTAEIKSAQEKLVTQSKLAALGALTAGIAHEIKNPLNFVNNFAELTADLIGELRHEIERNRTKLSPADQEKIEEILDTVQNNAGKIKEHGGRADSIVKSMLQHSRGKAGERQLTDINAMLEEDINLAYHGMRAQDSSFNIKMETELDPSVGKLDVVPQDVSRVFLNIISNACYEANRRKTTAGPGFSPTLTVRTRNLADNVEIRIRDNGNGIPEEIRDKLFTPFFTTKPAGQGTGLGLSISYDIVVQEHSGQLSFESQAGEYTEFIIRLPRNKK